MKISAFKTQKPEIGELSFKSYFSRKFYLMSLFAESLERILSWLIKNNPELALSLQPGLTREEIEEKVRNLPFRLPEEVYQLYQWRDGDGQWDYGKSRLLPGYSFIPLEAALEEYVAINQYREDLLQDHQEEVWQKPWFPILMFDPKEYLFIPGEVEKIKTAPVFQLFLESGESLKYATVTSMLLTIAECYETGAYYLSDGYLKEDEEKVASIQRKYNPEITIPDNFIPTWLQKPADLVDLSAPNALEQLTQALQTQPEKPEEVALQYMAARTLENLAQFLPPGMLKPVGDSQVLDPNHESLTNNQIPLDNPAAPLMQALQNLIYDGAGHEIAARRLGELKDPTRAVEPLLQALQHRSSQVRANAAQSLGKLGDERGVEPLIQALQDPDFFVRAQAARALGELRDPSATIPLIQQLQYEQHANPRSAAAWALGQIGDALAVDALLEVMRNLLDEYDVRIVSPAIAEALAAIETDRTTDALVETLRDRETVLRFPVHALYVAEQKFQTAIRALLKRQDPRLIDVLTQNLQDSDLTVRNITLGAIIKVKHENLVDLLILALSDRDKYLRETAVKAFREWKQAKAVEPLIQTLQDVELDVRVEAAWTLGEMTDVRAVEPLSEMLKDENYSLRGRAVWALGEIGNPSAIAPLTQCLKDSNEVVRKLAQEALQKLSASA